MIPSDTDSHGLTREDRKAWEMEMYNQGSEACRNYSKLTMRTRTLSQEVLLVSVVGAVIAKVSASGDWSLIVLAVGIALLPFSVSLAFVDWHYQSAFSAIRNSLADIEEAYQLRGPWRAHLKERTQFKDHIASYGPFLLLGAVGCLAIVVGVWKLGEGTITPVYFYLAMGPALLAAFWLFWVSFRLNKETAAALARGCADRGSVDEFFLWLVYWIGGTTSTVKSSENRLVRLLRSQGAYWILSIILVLLLIGFGLWFKTKCMMVICVLFLLFMWVWFFGLMCWLAARKDRGEELEKTEVVK